MHLVADGLAVRSGTAGKMSAGFDVALERSGRMAGFPVDSL